MINLVTALHCEARPLIRHYGLAAARHRDAFPVYEGSDVRLIITGVGASAAAAGTAYLGALYPDGGGVWLNIGIAGHARHELGRGFIANKISAQGGDACWYPALCARLGQETADLVTVGRPNRDYPGHALYDMEAAGFITAAMRFSTAELVHCYKVVSDNLEQPASGITHKRVRALVERRLPAIADVARRLADWCAQIGRDGQTPHIYARYLARWHFTVYQQKRLQRLLTRWQTLRPADSLWPPHADRMRSSRELLAVLEDLVDALPTPLGANPDRRV